MGLVDDRQMETIVAQRKVNGYMRKNNFQPHNMPMPKALLQNVKQDHFRYKKALEEKEKNKKSVGAIEIEIEIAGLNARKSQLEIRVEEYEKKADKHAFEAENKENLELFKLSNSLKCGCVEKQEDLDECLKKKQKLMSKSDI